MVYFQTKNANSGKFWSVLQWKMLEKIMDTSSILLPFGIFYGHFVIVWSFWYIFTFWYVVPRKIWQPWLRPRHFFLMSLSWQENPPSRISFHISTMFRGFRQDFDKQHRSDVLLSGVKFYTQVLSFVLRYVRRFYKQV
jgi:hypothetical protein